MTAIRIYIPLEFSQFVHQLRNIRFLCEYIGGEQCLAAVAWDDTVQHAKRNESLYIRLDEEHEFFYGALMNDYHLQFQIFLSSCALGNFDDIDRKQLDFRPLHDRLKLQEYTPRQPRWMKRKLEARQNDRTRRQRIDQNRDNRQQNNMIVNPDTDPQMRVPCPLRYRDVFHPNIRASFTPVNHPDGGEKCSNYHHRGYCFPNCRLANSHNKILTRHEREAGRRYVQSLINRYNARNNRTAPIVPNGNPPQNPNPRPGPNNANSPATGGT